MIDLDDLGLGGLSDGAPWAQVTAGLDESVRKYIEPRLSTSGDCWVWGGPLSRGIPSVRTGTMQHRSLMILLTGRRYLARACETDRCARPDHWKSRSDVYCPWPNRLWDKVEKGEDCWLWTGGLTGGYGRLYGPDGTIVTAHRATYEEVLGPIADGMVLDHLCRNRRCVRLDHLEPVTPWENLARANEDQGSSDVVLGPKFDLPPRALELVWAKVERRSNDDDCWPWTGAINGGGYGSFSFQLDGRPRNIGAHRLAFMLTVGLPPEGMVVHHKCERRLCCNPAHLAPLSRARNAYLGLIKLTSGTAQITPQGRPIRMRETAIRRLESGESLAQVASDLGLSGPTVSRWLNLWRRQQEMATGKPLPSWSPLAGRETTTELSAWCKQNAVSYGTALRWFHDGRLPVAARKVRGRIVLIDEPTAVRADVVADGGATVGYRVCRRGQGERGTIENQILEERVADCGWRMDGIVVDRQRGDLSELRKLLSDPSVVRIVLSRSAMKAIPQLDLLEAALSAQGRSLVIA